jgi:hypothetical protein
MAGRNPKLSGMNASTRSVNHRALESSPRDNPMLCGLSDAVEESSLNTITTSAGGSRSPASTDRNRIGLLRSHAETMLVDGMQAVTTIGAMNPRRQRDFSRVPSFRVSVRQDKVQADSA